MAATKGFWPKKAYLILYNAASAIAWATVLGRVAVVLWWKGAPFVPLVVDNFARITQTCAIMEVLHALTGASFETHPFPLLPLPAPLPRFSFWSRPTSKLTQPCVRGYHYTRRCPCPVLHHRYAGREPVLPHVGCVLAVSTAQHERLLLVDAGRLEPD